MPQTLTQGGTTRATPSLPCLVLKASKKTPIIYTTPLKRSTTPFPTALLEIILAIHPNVLQLREVLEMQRPVLIGVERLHHTNTHKSANYLPKRHATKSARLGIKNPTTAAKYTGSG